MFYIYENDLNPLFVSFSKSLHKNVESPSHLNFYSELVVCVKGRLEISVNYKKRILDAGEGTFISSLEVHEFLKGENEFFVFCFSPVLFSDMIKNLPINENAVGKLSEDGLSYIRHLSQSTLIYPRDEQKIRLLLSCLLYEIPCISTEPEKEGSLAICKAISYLEENYTEKITLDVLARELGVNRTYVSRMFSKYLNGATFIHVLNEIRLYYAIKQLGEKSIAETALEVGFGSVRQFNRVFKKTFGIPPGEYRRNDRKEKRKITLK